MDWYDLPVESDPSPNWDPTRPVDITDCRIVLTLPANVKVNRINCIATDASLLPGK